MNIIEKICAVWLLLSLFSFPIVARMLTKAPRGHEGPNGFERDE